MSRHLRPLRLLVSLLAVAVIGGAIPVAALTPQTVHTEDGLRFAMKAMHQLATDTREVHKTKKTTRPKKGQPIDLGKDGRLTMLLIGSDLRPGGGGERTDVMMVATIDPQTGKAAVASIPRDLSGIPLAGGSNSGDMRVNSIYYIRYRNSSLKHGKVDRKGLGRLSKDIGRFLGTEIDYWAMTRFDTFTAVVNKLGGLKLDIKEPVLDSSYHHGSSRGVWFPRKNDYKLRGDPKCKPKPRKCRSALVYARSRKGTMGKNFNSDFKRAERQQDIVHAGVKQVIDDWGSGVKLLGLLLGVRQHVETNLPTTTEAAAQLFAMLSKIKLPRSNMKVLAPGTWAYTDANRQLKPNLPAIRAWVDKAFYKVRKPKRDRS
jgi:anionic cell wall polymer biosynthesis LytR-Cps2A-Psr (LCP) family protein